MKSSPLSILSVMSAAFLCCGHLLAEQEMRSGEHVTSPDRRFTAELTDDPEGNLHIRSNSTSKLYKIGVLRPLYSLKWTGDSQTVITIEHLAGGSQAVLIHFNQHNWNRFEVDPTDAPPHIITTLSSGRR